jgi:hypothetical protein
MSLMIIEFCPKVRYRHSIALCISETIFGVLAFTVANILAFSMDLRKKQLDTH